MKVLYNIKLNIILILANSNYLLTEDQEVN